MRAGYRLQGPSLPLASDLQLLGARVWQLVAVPVVSVGKSFDKKELGCGGGGGGAFLARGVKMGVYGLVSPHYTTTIALSYPESPEYEHEHA